MVRRALHWNKIYNKMYLSCETVGVDVLEPTPCWNTWLGGWHLVPTSPSPPFIHHPAVPDPMAEDLSKLEIDLDNLIERLLDGTACCLCCLARVN